MIVPEIMITSGLIRRCGGVVEVMVGLDVVSGRSRRLRSAGELWGGSISGSWGCGVVIGVGTIGDGNSYVGTEIEK